jgi:hypothetical protein
MQPKARTFVLSLIAVILVINVLIFAKYNSQEKGRRESAESSVTAAVVAENGAHLNPDQVEIQKNDLKACCTFNLNGKEQTCFILPRYDCSHCDKYCSSE